MDTKENPEESRSDEILTAATRIVYQLPAVLSTLAGFGIVAYLVGWIYSRAYLGEFKALWLIAEVPTTTLLTNSWLPSLMLVVIVVLGISDLAEAAWRPKATEIVLRYGPYVALALIVAELILSRRGASPGVLFILVHALAWVWVVLAGAGVEAMVLAARDRPITLATWNLYLAFTVVVIGLHGVPTALGWSHAIRDLDPDHSTLPVAAVRGSSSKEPKSLRVLLVTSGRVYGVTLRPGTSPEEVMVIPWDQVLSIRERPAKPQPPQSPKKQEPSS